MKPTTHVAFEDTTGFRYVVPREAVCLSADKDGADNRAKLAWDHSRSVLISCETAARLRRELLGEPEQEAHTRHGVPPDPAAEPEFVPFRLGLLTADGTFSTTYPLEADEDVRRQTGLYGGRVVELFIRREDARP